MLVKEHGGTKLISKHLKGLICKAQTQFLPPKISKKDYTGLISEKSQVRVADNLLLEQKLFPATPAMEQWGWDLDTRVVGWEMLTG